MSNLYEHYVEITWFGTEYVLSEFVIGSYSRRRRTLGKIYDDYQLQVL